MPLHEARGQTEVTTDQSHFVLVEVAQRLDDATLSTQLAHQLGVVVVGLDGVGLA